MLPRVRDKCKLFGHSLAWESNKQGIPPLYLLVKEEVVKEIGLLGSRLFGTKKRQVYTKAKTAGTDTCVVGARKLLTRCQEFQGYRLIFLDLKKSISIAAKICHKRL